MYVLLVIFHKELKFDKMWECSIVSSFQSCQAIYVAEDFKFNLNLFVLTVVRCAGRGR